MGDFIILLQKRILNQDSTIIKLGASLRRQWKRCQGGMHEWSDQKEKCTAGFCPPSVTRAHWSTFKYSPFFKCGEIKPNRSSWRDESPFDRPWCWIRYDILDRMHVRNHSHNMGRVVPWCLRWGDAECMCSAWRSHAPQRDGAILRPNTSSHPDRSSYGRGQDGSDTFNIWILIGSKF